MSYLGDFRAGDVIDFKFTTLSTAGDGAPAALSSGAIEVFKNNSTASSTAGITLTINFAGHTGLNHVRLQTTGSTSFFADANNFQVVISTGAVGSVSLKGYELRDFSLLNRSHKSSTGFPASFDTAVFSTAAWFPSTGAPTNFATLAITTGGIADADVETWRGTQPSTYTDWLRSTGAPANFVNLAITTGGIVDADVETWRGTQPSTYTDWLRSTAAPTNFVSLAITTGGIVDADVETWRGTQPSTYTQWLASTEKPTNFSNLVVSTSGIVDANVQQWRSAAPSTFRDWLPSTALTTPQDILSTAPSATGASITDMIRWPYALSRLTLEQSATQQTLYRQGSTTALATAVLSATTSLATRSTWA